MSKLRLPQKLQLILAVTFIVRQLFFVACIFVVAALMFFYQVPASSEAMLSEGGRVEVTQNALIMVIFLLSLILSIFSHETKPVGIALASFMCLLFIREQNNFLIDNIGVGTMEALGVLVMLIGGGMLFRFRKQLSKSIICLCNGPAIGWVFAGIAAVLFAQNLDETELWIYLAGEDFPWHLKRFGEETVELLGYLLFTIGVVEYVFDQYLTYRISSKYGDSSMMP